MVSRNGNVMDRQYPELSILPHHLKAQTAILDGEIAALDERGVPSFELLQRRINVAEASAIATLARNHPVVFFAFDLLYLDGHDLRGVPLIERKRLLKEVLNPTTSSATRSTSTATGRSCSKPRKQQGLEGIVGKRATSFYESRRDSDWVKYKVTTSDSFVLCGFTEGRARPLRRAGAGDLRSRQAEVGRQRRHGLRSQDDAGDPRKARAAGDRQSARWSPTRTCPSKDVTWTRPELVCEVRFANWTDDGRLRAPVFAGSSSRYRSLGMRRADGR